MFQRARLVAIAPVLLANAASAPHPRSPTGTGEIAQATVDVGHVFQTGGSDGLILYALILSDAMMLLLCIVVSVAFFRHMAKSQTVNATAFAAKDKVNADQTALFVASMDRVARSLQALSVSVAGDLQERQATAAVLARLDVTDHRIINLLEDLKRVP